VGCKQDGMLLQWAAVRWGANRMECCCDGLRYGGVQTGWNAAAMGCGMVGCKQDGMLHCGDGLWYGGVQTGRNAALWGWAAVWWGANRTECCCDGLWYGGVQTRWNAPAACVGLVCVWPL